MMGDKRDLGRRVLTCCDTLLLVITAGRRNLLVSCTTISGKKYPETSGYQERRGSPFTARWAYRFPIPKRTEC